MAHAIYTYVGALPKAVALGLGEDSSTFQGLFGGWIEAYPLDHPYRKAIPRRRRTEAYRWSNVAYDIVQAFVEAWRCQKQPTDRRLSMMGVKSLQQFIGLMQTKTFFAIELGSYGRIWCFDHIRPLSSYDLNDPKQLQEAVHHSNLQPMTIYANMRKGRKWLCPKANPMLPGLQEAPKRCVSL